MDNEKKVYTITWNHVVKFGCLFGGIASVGMLVTNWFGVTDVPWFFPLGSLIPCWLGFFEARKDIKKQQDTEE
jgi:hypothetical protein